MPGEDILDRGPVALVERLFECFASRNGDALLELLSPEVEFFGPTATVLNEGKSYRGHEGMRRYFHDAERLWSELDLVPTKFREVGNHVVVLGRVRARARDGFELDAPAAWVWRVEQDLIVWGHVYGDRDAMPRSMQEGGVGDEVAPRRAGLPATL